MNETVKPLRRGLKRRGRAPVVGTALLLNQARHKGDASDDLPPYEWPALLDHSKTPAFVHDSRCLILQCNSVWDILGRMGGEEFAVLLPETDAQRALLVAERLRQAVESALVPVGDGVSVAVIVSIGVATMREEDPDVHALLSRPDILLYEAKNTGRNKVCLG